MPVLTDPLPPARCPGCGARIVDVLTMGDGRIPYYLCGSTPLRSVHVPQDPRPPATTNLAPLDPDRMGIGPTHRARLVRSRHDRGAMPGYDRPRRRTDAGAR
jgi:hypothetical protein